MRLLLSALLPVLGLALGFAACGGNDSGPDASLDLPDGCGCLQRDAQAASPDAQASSPDAGEPGPDAAQAGLDAAAAGPDAFVALDYDAGPKPCSFNTDCPPNERCDELAGFICTIGPRGNGKTGVDTCTNGNDCEGAVCLEGWPAGTLYCSGPCGDDAGTCGGQLTVCMNVPFVGVLCVRNLDGGM